jgi:hypothetical protein
MSHSLQECELNTSYLDTCDTCGELTSCVCLASIVSEWQIENTGQTGAFAYRYQYRKNAGDLVEKFGYAESYREAMDSVAHSVICLEEAKK